MKAGTVNLLKFRRLAAVLGRPLYQVTGLLVSLWDFVGENAPRGDIGKWTDEDIGFAIGWEGDSSWLVEVLVQTGWVDAHAEHRLVVHDWSEHCEDRVHLRLARKGLRFADGSMPRLRRLGAKEKGELLAAYGPPSPGRFEGQGESIKDMDLGEGCAHGVRTESAQERMLCARRALVGAEAASGVRTECALPLPVPDPSPVPCPCPEPVPDTTADTDPESLPKSGVGSGGPGRDRPCSGTHEVSPAVPEGLPRTRVGSGGRNSGTDPSHSGTRSLASVPELLSGSAMKDLMGVGKRPDSLAGEAWRVSGDGPEYQGWWLRVAAALEAAGELGTLRSAVDYAVSCRDPAQRLAKGLGELEAPGRYIAAQCRAALERHKRRLPPPPGGVGKGGKGLGSRV